MLAGFRRKSIIATVVSIALLGSVAAFFLYDLTVLRTNRFVDTLVYAIHLNGGEMPTDEQSLKELQDAQVTGGLNPVVNADTPYSTRYFVTVFSDGKEPQVDASHIAEVSKQQALELCQQVYDGGVPHGWEGNYRYGMFADGDETMVVFVDTGSSRVKDRVVFSGSIMMLFVFSLVIVLLNLFYNRFATKPVQDSVERQKRFISNASHELKTPLTLIMTDADLAAMELGPCEYLDDIKSECRDMSDLITQMVVLSRMDESAHPLEFKMISVSTCVDGVVNTWRGTAEAAGLKVKSSIDPYVMAKTDEAALKQVIVILMDNATKYCDSGGTINVEVHARDRKYACIYVENDYAKADNIEPKRLFERFYRADAERAEKIGHGIGLSLAKETTESLGGDIDVYTKSLPPIIGFKVVLKSN